MVATSAITSPVAGFFTSIVGGASLAAGASGTVVVSATVVLSLPRGAPAYHRWLARQPSVCRLPGHAHLRCRRAQPLLRDPRGGSGSAPLRHGPGRGHARLGAADAALRRAAQD